MRWNVSRVLRWALPLSLLGLLVLFYVGASILGWRLPGNHFMLGICSAWVVFGVTRALYTDALMQESQKRQELIELLDSTRGELAQEERRAGFLSERQRISRELHDTLAQSFTGIILHLQAAEQTLPSQPGQIELLRRHLEQAQGSARESLQEVRRLLSALRPGMLENMSLTAAVRKLVHV
jgi:signal transduction histidine kinase